MRLGSLFSSTVTVCALSTVTFGQSLHVGSPGVYGTPYATMGLNGASTWEMYLKHNDFGGPAPLASVVGSNVVGNNTQASFANQYLGGFGANPMWGANGQVVISPSVATTGYSATANQNSGVFYLKDFVSPTTPAADANGHLNIDFRLGFIEDPTGYVTAGNLPSPGKSMDPSENSGTRGIYVHYNVGNIGAGVVGQPGNNWAAPGSSIDVGYMKVGTNPTSTPGNVVTSTLINSGGAPTDLGVAYNSAMEVSGKLFVDPNDASKVMASIKLGNTINQFSFDPNDALFGGTPFNWQASKVVIYTGNGYWASDPGTLRAGVFAPGDATADGKVNPADTNALLANFGGTDKSYSKADFTQDGRVNPADTNVLLANFGKPISAPTAQGSEPTLEVLAGPTAGTVDLIVDVNTGNVQLVGGTGANTNNYGIESASGALIPGNWNKNAGWVTAGNTATILSEFTFGAALNLSDSSFDLGNIFAQGGAQDLVLYVFDSNFNDITGQITYVVPEPASLALFSLSTLGLLARRRKSAQIAMGSIADNCY